MLRCSIGVMAYNEEKNIVAALHALLNQQRTSYDVMEIVVVASGCTDRTVELAQQVAQHSKIIRIINEPERAGKAAAINQLLSVARGEVIVLVGADTLPDPTAVEELLRPFGDPLVGMTGARVIPLNAPTTLMGFAVHLLWRVHHHMALRWPKLGEMIAFRNLIRHVPTTTATDEVALEALITAQNYRLAYAPAAVVYNYGPTTLHDFLLQRRRIFTGHLQIARTYGYVAASMPPSHLLILMRVAMVRYIMLFPLLIVAMGLELWARFLGTIDFLCGRRNHIWRPVLTTKRVVPERHTITLVAIESRSDMINPTKLVRLMRSIPSNEGSLLWWRRSCNELLFMLPPGNLSRSSVQYHIHRLMSLISSSDAPDSVIQSYRIIQFGTHCYSDLLPELDHNDSVFDSESLRRMDISTNIYAQ